MLMKTEEEKLKFMKQIEVCKVSTAYSTMYSCIVEDYGIVQGREYFGILAVANWSTLYFFF